MTSCPEINAWNAGCSSVVNPDDCDPFNGEQRFVALADQTLFILTAFSYAPGTNSLQVHRNGLLVDPVNVVEVSGTSFWLQGENVQAGDIVVANALTGVTAEVEVLVTNLHSYEVTLIAGQLIVPFPETVPTANSAPYISGPGVDNGRLVENTDYTVDQINNIINLTDSYPVGTILLLVYNDAGAEDTTLELPDNTVWHEFSSELGTNSHLLFLTGANIRTNYYDSAYTPNSGASFKFTGTITVGKAGNVPNADGYFYDADGKQFAVMGAANVLKFGASGLGVLGDSSAIQAAVSSLPVFGGIVDLPDALNFAIDVGITVGLTDFPAGGVLFRMHPRTRMTVASGVVGITFTGTTTSPLDRCGIESGQIVSGFATGQGGVKLENCTRFSFFKRPLISGFRATTGDGSRYGIWAEYAIYTNLGDAAVNNCDTGIRIEQDPTNAFRSTTLTSNATVSRCQRGYELKDLFHADLEGSVENCSAGMYIHGEETTGTNCRGLHIGTYFERNGTHIISRNVTSAINYGLMIQNCLFETLQTTFVDTEAFQNIAGVTVNLNKLDLECSLSNISDNTFTSQATLDIRIGAGDENTIGTQDATSATVIPRLDVDGATNTIDLITKNVGLALPTADATPSVRLGHTFSVTNAAPQSITAFDDGYTGKTIYLRAGDGNTTLVHSAGLLLQGGINITMTSGEVIALHKHTAGVWSQI